MTPVSKSAVQCVTTQLEKLMALPLVTDEDEQRWDCARYDFEAELTSRFPAFQLEHHVQHFFDDVDIHRKDPGYRDWQHSEIADYIRRLQS